MNNGMPESYRAEVEEMISDKIDKLVAALNKSQIEQAIAVIEACGFKVIENPPQVEPTNPPSDTEPREVTND